MRRPLFMDGDAASAAYRNIRSAKTGRLFSARCLCEYLWILFEPYADPDFRTELKSNFNARFWEMYLTASFIFAGFEVTCPKPGPDVGITYKGQRIWFEAVSPTPGEPNSPDYVPEPRMGEVSDVPNEKMVLRYLNSISEKYERQYANWIAKKYISEKDAFVIALNPRNIPLEYADTEPPRILQAAYTIGHLFAVIDKATLQITGTGYHFRDHIAKTLKADAEQNTEPTRVTTGVFQDGQHNGLSALLCSRVDAANQYGEFGDDFQLVPNPHAGVPLHQGFRLRGTYFGATRVEGGYEVVPTSASKVDR
ncbi:hypothetical protein [Bradyrhizobium sp.]|uniref:hypothetical protein n=1 Tax=Bradyrhizobium sp. TaxID=376 RepID=UPI0040384239